MKNIKFSLAWQILFAMVLGILLGSYLHYHSDSRDWLVVNLLSPAGDIFIHLIKMIVVPIVISTLVVGIAGVGDAKQLGRIGAKTIIYFEVITTVAIILVLTLMVTSKGIAGVPGVSFVVLLATLGSVGIPLEGLAFIAGVDRILDMARTALNVVGNALAVLVIAKWEHKFDRKKALAYEREVLGKFDKTADQ
ncbi:cation:dicarboxylase symporter family transporter [Shigella boydii]|nr:cation:dicarboxylase symporter family transporter [Shigella boydii]